MLRARTYDITAALAGALARERDEHERALSIAKLGPLDQIVLAAAAHARSLFSRSALEQYARHLGVEKVTAKAVQGALARLRDEQLIYQAARGTYRVNNSVLAGQLRESTPQMTDPKAARGWKPGNVYVSANRRGLRVLDIRQSCQISPRPQPLQSAAKPGSQDRYAPIVTHSNPRRALIDFIG
jgi:hypothetical protein